MLCDAECVLHTQYVCKSHPCNAAVPEIFVIGICIIICYVKVMNIRLSSFIMAINRKYANMHTTVACFFLLLQT